MICLECNGKGEAKYYREIDRDENSVTVEGYLDVCHACHGSGKKPVTNSDHIRSMTDEDFAALWVEPFCDRRTSEQCKRIYHGDCIACVLDWLKQPYKEA